LPYSEEDGAEDDRDDLMETLGARSLPTLAVMDPLSTGSSGRVVADNAVMEVQAAGAEGMGRLIQKWKNAALANRRQSGTTCAGPAAAAGDNVAAAVAQQQQGEKTEGGGDEAEGGDEDESLVLKYQLPDSSPALLCRYFRTQLLSPHLPSALSSIVLRREDLTLHPDAMSLVDSLGLRTNAGPGERWVFRTAAPALPVDGWGGSFGLEAVAVECWEIERDNDNNNGGDDDDEDDTISRAVVTIENETGRYLLVFRETIVMERSPNGSGCEVTKTLNLDGVPGVAHAAFARRWRRESEAIFHALLGTCDRKKMMKGDQK